jgi:uncharacterized membrane protein YgaE (UPF0421/DUF939 family)
MAPPGWPLPGGPSRAQAPASRDTGRVEADHGPLERLLTDSVSRLRGHARLRERAGRGRRRVSAAYWTIGQCAIGAMIAWLIASRYVHHGTPVFAPIAAVVCLGLSHSARVRRMVELAAGVSIGVGLADLLIRLIGSGWWQIGLIVLLAMATAQFLGGGTLITNQAAVQAIFLVALPQPAGGGLARWEDALIGSVTALVVAAALPPDPVRAVRPSAQQLITELADVVEAAARAVRTGDSALADVTLDRARATQVNVERLADALQGGEEIARISPLRRGRRDELARYRRTLIGVDRATRNMRVAFRRIAAVLERGQGLPGELSDVLVEMGAVLRTLHDQVGTAMVEVPHAAASRADPPDPASVPYALRDLAARLDPARLGARTMSTTVVVAQIRSAVVDLLEVTGMDTARARRLLPKPSPPNPP